MAEDPLNRVRDVFAPGRELKNAMRPPRVNDATQILTSAEICQALGIHRNTISTLVADGLPAFRLSARGHWRIRQGDLEDWIETRKHKEGA